MASNILGGMCVVGGIAHVGYNEYHAREKYDVFKGVVMEYALQQQPSLTTSLTLTGSILKDNLIKGLARGLSVNNTLTELDLSHCTLEDSGGTVLANGLRWNQSLRILNLTGNLIGQEGALDLASLFHQQEDEASNMTLISLDLSHNRGKKPIKEATLKEIEAGCERNGSLL